MGTDTTEPSFDLNNDLDEVWPQVVAQYEQVTKKTLDPRTTLKSFQLRIEQDLQQSSLKGHSAARRILSNIGACLDQFGNIIAQSASIVFGPASQCMNAISFVIAAAGKFNDILNGFVTLMERSSAFIDRLNFFLQQECVKSGSHLPRHLRKPAYAILAQFLGVVRSSYKLATSKREKMKSVFNVVLFNSDAGVEESLNLMELRVKDFTNCQVDEILVDVKGLARYMRDSEEELRRRHLEITEHLESINRVSEQVLDLTRQMKATLDGRTTKEQHKEDLTKLWAALGFSKAKEQDWWMKRHDDITRVRVPNSGKWLEQRDLGFSSWADTSQHDIKAFVLEADSGSGKTFVSNYAISYLQERYRPGPGADQAYVAYYYYGDNEDEAIENCVGTIVHQLAKVDVGYAKAMAIACSKKPNLARAEDRWNHLVTTMQSAMKGTYFICIDGLDTNVQSSELKSMIATMLRFCTSRSEDNGVSIRLFVSGTEDGLGGLPKDGQTTKHLLLKSDTKQTDQDPTQNNQTQDGEPLLSPMIPQPNAEDLELVTRARINDLCKVKPDLRVIMDESKIAELIKGIRGNYQRLEAKLTEIKSCDTQRKVEEAIANFEDDLNTFQRNTLTILNATLSSDQIRKLNEILVWVVGMGPVDIELLQSVLYYRYRENFLLESEITNRYAPMLTLQQNRCVALKSEEFINILRGPEDDTHEANLLEKQTRDVSQQEIDFARRFVKKTFDSFDYKRFKFDDFFSAMALKAHVTLDDENTVALKLAEICVGALWDREKDDSLKRIMNYASLWFYEYIKKVVDNFDNFEADRQVLTSLGEKVVGLFYDPLLIDTWFKEANLIWLKYDWVQGDDFLDMLQRFLKNPHVAKGFAKDSQKRDWVKTIIAEDANRYTALEHVAARLARNWFSCNDTIDQDYLFLSYAIVAKLDGRKYEEGDAVSLTEIEEFIKWAKSRVQEGIDEHVWIFRAGAIYKVFEHHKEAVAIFEQAEPHLPNSYGLFIGLARSYDTLKDYHASLKYNHKFKALSDRYLESDEYYKMLYWDEVLSAEGICHKELKEYDEAAQCFMKVLEHEFVDDAERRDVQAQAVAGLFETYVAMKKSSLIVNFLRNLGSAMMANRNATYWFEVITWSDTTHGYVVVAARENDALDEIHAMYQEAIDAMLISIDLKGPDSDETGVQKERMIRLKYIQAILYFHGSKSQEDHDRGIARLKDIVKESTKTNELWWTTYQASRRLALALLDQGTRTNLTSSTLGNYIKSLEELCRSNTDVVRSNREGYFDARFCLARLYTVTDKKGPAHMVAQSKLRSIFDHWPEDNQDWSLAMRYFSLAQTLAILDRDDDAIAAWQAVKPSPPGESNTDEPNSEDSTSVADITPAPKSEEQPETDGKSEARVVDEEFPSSDADETSMPANNPLPDTYIHDFSCDAACGVSWSGMLSDLYVCKHCLCIQLCPACYQKLHNDELDPLLCNKAHKHLYIPPFDEDFSKKAGGDTIFVAKKPVPRQNWLHGIREEFEVQQDQIDVFKISAAKEIKAASLIARYYFRWRRRIRDQKKKKDKVDVQPMAEATGTLQKITEKAME